MTSTIQGGVYPYFTGQRVTSAQSPVILARPAFSGNLLPLKTTATETHGDSKKQIPWHLRLGRSFRRLYNAIYIMTIHLRFMGGALLAQFLPVKSLHRFLERLFLYHVTKNVSRNDIRNDGLREKMRDEYFLSPDGKRLHGWYIPAAPGKNKPTVIFAHGRFANITYSEDLMKHLMDQGYGIFTFDYRGFGKSKGKPDEEGVYMDFDAACRHIETKYGIPVSEQVAMGYSLGGAVVANSAIHNPFKAVVLVSTFTRLKDSLTHCKNQLYPVIRWMFKDNIIQQKFDTLGKIAQVRSPLLLIGGTEDLVTPIFMGKTLYDEASGAPVKRFSRLKGYTHATIFREGIKQVVSQLDTFLADLPRLRPTIKRKDGLVA